MDIFFTVRKWKILAKKEKWMLLAQCCVIAISNPPLLPLLFLSSIRCNDYNSHLPEGPQINIFILWLEKYVLCYHLLSLIILFSFSTSSLLLSITFLIHWFCFKFTSSILYFNILINSHTIFSNFFINFLQFLIKFPQSGMAWGVPSLRHFLIVLLMMLNRLDLFLFV